MAEHVRRLFEIAEKCDIDVVADADDVLFELMADGAVGWFAGRKAHRTVTV